MRFEVRPRWIGRAACALVVCLLAAGIPPAPARADQVRLVDLERLTQRAARIFAGRCIESRVEFDAAIGRDVTTATFLVHRAVKGVSEPTVTVRMLGEAVPATRGRPAATPAFRAGEKVVLFLYAESGLGLASPVGLGQGRFRIVADKHGRERAVNALGNRNLLTGLRPEARARVRLESDAGDDSAADARIAAREADLDVGMLLDAAAALARPGR